jgi:hypothetical protein
MRASVAVALGVAPDPLSPPNGTRESTGGSIALPLAVSGQHEHEDRAFSLVRQP